MKKFYDVIVVGAGHAGCEAAAAAARMKKSVCLITNKISDVGAMSCNPSIGGVAKGIIVKEVDALDGLMGRAIDKAGIHFKILNKSKGPAVWGPRAQADRVLYKKVMQDYILNYENLDVYEDEVVDLLLNNSKIKGVKSRKNKLYADSVVVTAGTFFNGVIHLGSQRTKAGRFSENPSIRLANKIRSLQFKIGRLKTGTPPRLYKGSINWSVLEEQKGDVIPVPFSYMNSNIELEQISCFISHTNKATHKIIKDNLHLSPIYSGAINSIGPRYCPSIEDKIVRFADKERHQVFLEPEGLDSSLIYPNGISTAFPKEVQEKIIYSIKGMENAKIARYGYAIEYDFLDPRELKETLESKKIEGLFFAGQINGTTGYEEAAGQGVVAGINAALKLDNNEFILTRSEAYIGVMINDLITRGVSEPYRMMTSRAEYRIKLRSDNADTRITEKAFDYGIISNDRKKMFLLQKARMKIIKNCLAKKPINKEILNKLKKKQIASKKNILSIMSYPDFNIEDLYNDEGFYKKKEHILLKKIHIEQIYKNYEKRMQQDIEILNKDRNIIIPEGINFDKIAGLSNEIRGKLMELRPRTLADIKRIQGMTPAAIVTIQINLNMIQK